MRSPLYRLSAFKLGYAIAQLLPRPVLLRLADGAARWSMRRTPQLRQILRENLAVATGCSGGQLDQLVRDNARLFAHTIADYFRFAGARADHAGELVSEWEGWEHLVAARQRGKGTIVITGHLGHWELGGLVLALKGLPMTVVTLPEPSDELTRWRGASRRRLGIQTIAVGPGHEFAFVEMLRVLRGNGVLAMLVDRPYSGTGLPVKQFGRETQFSTAAAMLAHHTGAAVVPAVVLRQPDGRYRALACPPVEMTQGSLRDTLPVNVQRIADVFETQIRLHPDQWFNYAPLFSAS
ncbi:MAG: lysophospholipid acyltransferase family protein [Chthoniobacteraceae bacterium]